MRALRLMPVLVLLACHEPPAYIRKDQKLELINTMQRDLLVSMEAEKSAVLATTDEESTTFANAWKSANAAVVTGQAEVRRLVKLDNRPTEKAALARFDEAWDQLVAIDTRLLELAVANTNVKASRLAAGEGLLAVGQLVDALTALEGNTRDVAVVRELSGASVAALRIQALLPTHIASADDAEMTRLDAQMSALGLTVEQALSKKKNTEVAAEAWARYQKVNAEIVRLSRLNTNVRSFDLSVHGKRDAMIGVQSALAALKTAVQDVPRATR